MSVGKRGHGVHRNVAQSTGTGVLTWALWGEWDSAGGSSPLPLGMTRSMPGTRWELTRLPSTNHRQFWSDGGGTGWLFSCENKVTFLVSFLML